MGVMYVGYRKRKAGLNAIVHSGLWSRVVPSLHYGRRVFRYSLWILALVFMVFAIMRPQYGLKFETITRRGQDIFIALDTSKSMLAQDIGSSRFDYAKQEIKGFIENLRGDRVGLIAFSGDAFIQCPLTLDYSAINLFLDDLRIGSVPIPGTDIATAIKKARLGFDKTSTLKKKILVIISDGESFENDPVKSAEVAAENGMVIYTVSIGSLSGEPIPVPQQGFKKDKQNQIVLSKADHGLMSKVAQKTGGEFFVARGYGVLDSVYKAISQIEKQSLEDKLYQSYKDQYQPLLLIVFLLLFVEFLVPDRLGGKPS